MMNNNDGSGEGAKKQGDLNGKPMLNTNNTTFRGIENRFERK